jgi:transcriptional regulator with XRE-family HTH domain
VAVRFDIDKIHLLLAERNMSFLDLARKIGKTRSTLNDVLRHRRPYAKTIARVADGLGVSVREITRFEPDSKTS